MKSLLQRKDFVPKGELIPSDWDPFSEAGGMIIFAGLHHLTMYTGRQDVFSQPVVRLINAIVRNVDEYPCPFDLSS